MSNEKSDGFWISISDLMSGLMVIFLFIAVAYMYEIKDIFQGVIYITEGFEDTEESLYKELMKEFKNDLENWNAEIDAKTLSVIFKEPDILFGKGEHEIKPMFRKILNDFLARKYVEPRPAENPQAKTEYRITEIGHKTYESFKEFLAAPGRKHMLGIKEDEDYFDGRNGIRIFKRY